MTWSSEQWREWACQHLDGLGPPDPIEDGVSAMSRLVEIVSILDRDPAAMFAIPPEHSPPAVREPVGEAVRAHAATVLQRWRSALASTKLADSGLLMRRARLYGLVTREVAALKRHPEVDRLVAALREKLEEESLEAASHWRDDCASDAHSRLESMVRYQTGRSLGSGVAWATKKVPRGQAERVAELRDMLSHPFPAWLEGVYASVDGIRTRLASEGEERFREGPDMIVLPSKLARAHHDRITFGATRFFAYVCRLPSGEIWREPGGLESALADEVGSSQAARTLMTKTRVADDGLHYLEQLVAGYGRPL